MSEYGQFLRGLFDHPLDVSAPTPSSPALAAAIAAKVDTARSGLVLELGAGTGAVTEALLARGIAAERLIAIENGEFFATLLAERFAGIKVVCGDALHFERHVPARARIATIVSCLPLLNFPIRVRHRLIRRALEARDPDGVFVQLSYGWQPAAKDAAFAASKAVVWRNFPPAHIWTYRRASRGMSCHH